MNIEKPKAKSTSLLYFRLGEAIRLWQIVAGIAIVLVVLQSVTIFTILPLKETTVKYVEFNSSEDVYYRMIPSSELTPDQKKTLVRKALRKYVYDRNLKDDLTEKVRVRDIRVMSNKAVWEEFKRQFTIMIENMDDVRRNVQIVSDSQIAEGVHQIEFRTEDERGLETKVREYVATIGYDLNEAMLSNVEEDHFNPLGIVIKKYNVSERNVGTGETDEN